MKGPFRMFITAFRVQHVIVRIANVLAVLGLVYITVSVSLAMILAYQPQMPITRTPASLGLRYHDVSFFSRDDHVLLRGWFLPGMLSEQRLTVTRTIVLVHGLHANRSTGIMLDLSSALVHQGFAVFTFDMRGHGDSTPAALSGGTFEQRDVLGAVDFLRYGPLPYPELGRPQFIGGWGISMGAVALLLAAAQEPTLLAVVSDSAYATLESLIRHNFGPAFCFIPGMRVTTRLLYGVDAYSVRPIDIVAQIAPRPLLFIHGDADTDVPPSDMFQLAAAASRGNQANVQTWLVPDGHHIEAYYAAKSTYVHRVLMFFVAALR